MVEGDETDRADTRALRSHDGLVIGSMAADPHCSWFRRGGRLGVPIQTLSSDLARSTLASSRCCNIKVAVCITPIVPNILSLETQNPW